MVITVLDHQKTVKSENKDFHANLTVIRSGNSSNIIKIVIDTYISDIPIYETSELIELIVDESDKIKLLATETFELRIDNF